MDGWNINNNNTVLFGWSIFRGYVSCREGIPSFRARTKKERNSRNSRLIWRSLQFFLPVPSAKKTNAMSHVGHEINKNIAMKWTYSWVHWFGIHPKKSRVFWFYFFPTYQPLKPEKFIDHGCHLFADVNWCSVFEGGGGGFQLRQCEARNGDMLFPYHPSMYSYVLVWYITVLHFACF